MQGSFFRFHVHENHRHRGRLIRERLLERLHQEKVRLSYAYTPACFGVINPDTADPRSVADCR
ncbi:MAG: hypothetical protein WBE92_05995 [Steroidobacteraceae bacterium]